MTFLAIYIEIIDVSSCGYKLDHLVDFILIYLNKLISVIVKFVL